MEAERWRQIERLYDAALKRPADEREAFLDNACGGDEALRRRIDILIAAQEKAGDFLESPAWAMVADAPAPDHPQFVVGRSIDRYQILSFLGSGGIGDVYLARDSRLERAVALKLLPARFTGDGDRVRHFEKEVRATSALNHPNIVAVYDTGETDAGRFIVMELVAGRTLREVVASGRPSLDSVAHIVRQVAEALTVAHSAGIVHRDVKPENIMVRDDGYVKVLDFGLARLLPSGVGELAGTGASHTNPGILLGTAHYMSPEQARGEAVTSATDVFSLGIVCYELATGEHPFKADSQIGVLHRILSHAPVPPGRLNPGVSSTLDALILDMLEKDPRLRPGAAEIKAVLAERPEQPVRVRSRSNARKVWQVTAAGLLAATLAGATVFGQTTIRWLMARVQSATANDFVCVGQNGPGTANPGPFDNVSVRAETTCLLRAGTRVQGSVTVEANGRLTLCVTSDCLFAPQTIPTEIRGSVSLGRGGEFLAIFASSPLATPFLVGGDIHASGARRFRIVGATVGGRVQITHANITGTGASPGPIGFNEIARSRIHGEVQLSDSIGTGPGDRIRIPGNVIEGDVHIAGNNVTLLQIGPNNSMKESLRCNGNLNIVPLGTNVVEGNKEGQCSDLP